MTPPTQFVDAVKQAHGSDQWAAVLYAALKDKSKAATITPDRIPCVAWCMLTFALPVAVGNYIAATQGGAL